MQKVHSLDMVNECSQIQRGKALKDFFEMNINYRQVSRERVATLDGARDARG